MKNNDPWYVKIFALLKLETVTPHGKLNLAGTVVLAVFCLLYTSADTIRHAISAAESVAKTIVLKQNIHYEYESVGLLPAVAPIFILFITCILLIVFNEKRKNNVKNIYKNKKEN